MKRLFADTFYFVALMSKSDTHHRRALEWSDRNNVRIVTTAWIIVELADACSSPGKREKFHVMLHALQRNPRVEIVPPTFELLNAGLALHAGRSDKYWSLTDCISFTVMERGAMSDALTGDHHFRQAGFNAILA